MYKLRNINKLDFTVDYPQAFVRDDRFTQVNENMQPTELLQFTPGDKKALETALALVLSNALRDANMPVYPADPVCVNDLDNKPTKYGLATGFYTETSRYDYRKNPESFLTEKEMRKNWASLNFDFISTHIEHLCAKFGADPNDVTQDIIKSIITGAFMFDESYPRMDYQDGKSLPIRSFEKIATLKRSKPTDGHNLILKHLIKNLNAMSQNEEDQTTAQETITALTSIDFRPYYDFSKIREDFLYPLRMTWLQSWNDHTEEIAQRFVSVLAKKVRAEIDKKRWLFGNAVKEAGFEV